MATTHLFTVQDVEHSPPEGDWELIDGELIPVNPTSFKSSLLAARILRIVGTYVDDRNLGIMTGADGGFVLFSDRETLLAPDVAFIRSDRVPPEAEQGRFARLAPDLVVEVLSPSDRLANALSKVSIYLQAGVQVVWLVDPVKGAIVVFAGENTPLTLGEDDTLDGGAVLPGFRARIADLLGR